MKKLRVLLLRLMSKAAKETTTDLEDTKVEVEVEMIGPKDL